MSNERPKGSYAGPLSLQWCAYSMTVRAMPMNYLAADLSRIDAALWGRESEIGAAIAEAPAMVEALRDLVKGNYGQPRGVTVPALDPARAILSRIDGAGDTLPDAPALTATCPHCGRDNTGHEGEPCADDCPQYWEGQGRQHPQHPTGEEPYALKAARGYASNPEQWNPPSPEQMAEILAMIDRKGEN